jgi:hypothetical protein
MPAWLDMTLALSVVAAAIGLLVYNVRRPRCASCPQPSTKGPRPSGGADSAARGPVLVAIGATRLGRRSERPG